MAFSVVCPIRSVLDDHARVLAKHGLLDSYITGTRRGTKGIPGELTYLNPAFGLWTMGTRRICSGDGAEWLRSAAHPVFDRLASIDVKPGDHVISSYGYANRCFKKARAGGGKAFVDAGNSHPAHFWEVIQEEHRRWKVRRDPYPRHWNRQGLRSVELADYVFTPSQHVAESFRARGFGEEQLLHLPYPVDLSVFQPRLELKVPPSPLRVVCTGSVSLRKGFPYLFEAIRLIRKERDAILVLMQSVESSMKDILSHYADVPVEWSPSMPHDQLALHLKGCHVFALLSLEEGMARTALEAMACGLPVVLTPNTGTSDLVTPGVNGEVVGIRDPAAAAAGIIACHERQLAFGPPRTDSLRQDLSMETFESRFMNHLRKIGLVNQP
jgi:glycosyltransferase involved in cell wall biosynthesis